MDEKNGKGTTDDPFLSLFDPFLADYEPFSILS